jgi:CHAT domain-containing protein
MKIYRSLFFLLIFAALNLKAQTSAKLIQIADSLLKVEDYAGSLKIRNQIILQLGSKKNDLLLQQQYKQQLTEGYLAESPVVAVAKTKKAFSYFNQLKAKPIGEQMDLYNLLYHSLAYNNQNTEALEAALTSYRKLGKKTIDQDVIDLVYDIGFLYSRIDNYFEAINYYKKSLALYVKIKGEVNNDVALNYNNLAYVYSYAYNQKYTINYYKKAAGIWEKVYAKKDDEKDYLLTVYQNLNATLIEYGALDEAKIYLKKLNTHFRKKYIENLGKTKPGYFAARQLIVLANVRTNAAMGDYNKAKIYCDSLKAETKFSAEKKEDIAFVVNSYALIADFSYDKKEYLYTIAICKPILKIADQYDLKHQKMIINAKLASSYEKLKELNVGLKHVNLADENSVKDQFNSSKFSIRLIKAKILAESGDLKAAQILTKQTIEQILFEKTSKKVAFSNAKFEMVQDLGSDNFINIFAVSGHLYLDFYEQTKDKSQLKDAKNLFSIAAKLFSEYYLQGEYNESLNYYQQLITDGILKSLVLSKADFKEKTELINLVERNASQHLIKAYHQKLRRSNSKNNGYIDQLNALKQEISYYQKLQKSDKRYEQKINSVNNQITELTKKISLTEKNYALFNAANFDINDVLKTLDNDEQLLKYYVTDEHVFIIQIDKKDIVIKQIVYNTAVKTQIESFIAQSKQVNSAYQKNASALFRILMPTHLAKNIIIVPDGLLNYLPFESLYSNASKKYIVQEHVVAYDYALPMYLLRKQLKTSFNYKTQLAAFAPNYGGDINLTRDASFKDLKFAKQEAETISKLFDGDFYNAKLATKKTFISQMEKYKIFHLSMHSQLYEDDFNKSFLLFANNEKLYFSELYGMNIPAHMVVLSACNTGNGLMKSGEGIMSMSRALSYAGVQSAIVSLWQVPDKETSEIMVLFYQNLKDGQSKAEALANAKTTFITANPMKNHPFYWAGFIINGDASPIYNPYTWWIIGFGLLVVVGVLTIIVRKRLVKIGK